MYYYDERKNMPKDVVNLVNLLSGAMNDHFFQEYLSEEHATTLRAIATRLQNILEEKGWSAVRNEMTGIWEPCPKGYSIVSITPLGTRTFYCPIAVEKGEPDDELFYFAGARVGRLGNSKIVFEKWYQAYNFLFLYANGSLINCNLFPWVNTKEDTFVIEHLFLLNNHHS